MNCVILQPSYVPWRGYFHEVLKADRFIFYDDVQYDARGWRNRNRVKTPHGPKWLTVPARHKGCQAGRTPAREIRICPDKPWQSKHWHTLEQSYRKAPFFDRYAPLLREFYGTRWEFLCDLTIEMTVALARELGIRHTQFLRASTLDVGGSKTDRLLNLVQRVGATHYITGPSAKAYLEEDKLRDAGVTVEYMRYEYPEYPQLHPPYDGKVSILDLLFMTGPEALDYIVAPPSTPEPAASPKTVYEIETRPRPVEKEIEIRFNRAAFEGNELELIGEAVRNGHISGDGPFTRRCHEWLETVVGVRKALLTTSCTDALEMTAILLDLQPGDEVIVPSFTFVSSVNAFVLHGARPVFCDIRPDTLNLDETQLRERVGPRTKAIVVVHYGGVACEMEAIQSIADRNGVTVIEDNAHGLLGRYRGRSLGTFGALATLSFHETKNFTCGEGGALLINDERHVERAEVIREKGTNRARFARGLVDKYTWVDVGSSFLPSDVLAAFLYAQFQAAEQIQARRRRVWHYYFDHLRDWARQQHVRMPIVPPHCDQAYHLFYLLLPTPASRDALIAHLRARGILSVFHYVPLHLSAMGRRFGGTPGECPVTEDSSERLLRLPFYGTLTESEQARVVEAVKDFAV